MPDYDKLNNAIDSAASAALGGDRDGELSRERALAIDAYGGRNLEPAPEGRSQVVDWTVFETIQWLLPSLTRIFAGDDNVVEFVPMGPEDEQAAEQESDYLNYLVTQKNNWFLTLLTFFQDALLTKNAYCMAFMEEKLKTETERYEGQSEESLALLMDEEGLEIVEASAYPDPDDDGIRQDPMTGQPIQMEPRSLYDVTVRKTTPSKRLRFKVLPPERCLVGEDTPDFTTENANYFEYQEDTTISDLRAMGFDVPDDVAYDDDHVAMEEDARDRFEESFGRSDPPDPSMRVVRARTIWIRHDYDGDGIAELQRVVRVGREILDREVVSRIPVASIVPFINTHRHIGASVADLTFDLQRIKTALLRGGLDSLYLSQNPRHVVSGEVNLDDMLVSRPGGVVRLSPGAVPSEGHVLPLTTEFTLPQTLEGLRHMESVVESRVGVNRMFQGIDQNALSSTNAHNAIGQLSTMAAQRVEQIARIFANGVEYLFSIAHELIIKSGHQNETVKLRGQWVQIDPSQWRTGRDMRVVAPFAAGNKDSLVQRLMLHLSIHEKALAAGAPFVQVDDTYELAKMLASATDVMPDKIYTDPRTLPPKQPPPDYTMMALEVENKKAENQARDTEVDANVALTKAQMDTELDKYRADLQAETQIILAQLKSGAQVDLEGMKARLRDAPINQSNEIAQANSQAVQALTQQVAASIAQISEAINDLKSQAEAPREVVRDKSGKVTGVKVNGKVRPVNRDEDGRITGV